MCVLTCKPLSGGVVGTGDLPFQLDIEFGDFLISGLKISTNASQSTAVSIASGSCVIQGFHVDEDGTGSIAAATSATNYVFIQITVNASAKPTSVAYIATTAESTANAMRLGKIVSTAQVSSVEIGAFGAAMVPFNTIQFAYGQLGSAIA